MKKTKAILAATMTAVILALFSIQPAVAQTKLSPSVQSLCNDVNKLCALIKSAKTETDIKNIAGTDFDRLDEKYSNDTTKLTDADRTALKGTFANLLESALNAALRIKGIDPEDESTKKELAPMLDQIKKGMEKDIDKASTLGEALYGLNTGSTPF